jgi:urease accessory protein
VAPALTQHRVALGIACAATLLPRAALAHGSMQVGDFYGGLSQPLFHPESLLLVVVVLLWSVQRGAPLLVRGPAAFAIGVVAGSALAAASVACAPAVWCARAAALALGLLVAARIAIPAAIAVPLLAAIGVAAGHVATWPDRDALARPWLYSLGLGAGVAIAWGWIASFALRYRTFWAEVGLRILGSWIATVALLLSALALARR